MASAQSYHKSFSSFSDTIIRHLLTSTLEHIFIMSSKSTKASCITFLCDSLATRKTLQKAEFFMYWAFFFLTAVRSSHAILVENTSPSLLLQPAAATILYFRLSLLTRSYAYAVDLVNAWVRFDSSIPKWLVLHHSGVWLQHVIKVFFLTPHSPLQIMMFALASQSSHNTWTKKYSLPVYWGNVVVGVLACLYLNCFEHESSIFASRCFYYSFLLTNAGILLLVKDTFISSKMKKRIDHDVTRTEFVCIRRDMINSSSMATFIQTWKQAYESLYKKMPLLSIL